MGFVFSEARRGVEPWRALENQRQACILEDRLVTRVMSRFFYLFWYYPRMVKNAARITEEELLQALDDAAKPIDFEELIAAGIIEKDGAWYRVPDMSKLPQHAVRKIKTVQTGPKGTRVKFRPARRDIIALNKKVNRKR